MNSGSTSDYAPVCVSAIPSRCSRRNAACTRPAVGAGSRRGGDGATKGLAEGRVSRACNSTASGDCQNDA